MAGALPRMLWQHLPRAAAAAPASSSKLQFALGAFQRRSIATLRSKPNSAPLRFSRQTTRRFYSSEPPKSNQTVKFWPFFLIILGGTGGYILLANQRNQSKSSLSLSLPLVVIIAHQHLAKRRKGKRSKS